MRCLQSLEQRFRLPMLGSAYHSAGMSDLAIYRQLTGERESRMPKTQRSYLTPFHGTTDATCHPESLNDEVRVSRIHAQFVATLLY
jgi:hypothetical protein